MPKMPKTPSMPKISIPKLSIPKISLPVSNFGSIPKVSMPNVAGFKMPSLEGLSMKNLTGSAAAPTGTGIMASMPNLSSITAGMPSLSSITSDLPNVLNPLKLSKKTIYIILILSAIVTIIIFALIYKNWQKERPYVYETVNKAGAGMSGAGSKYMGK